MTRPARALRPANPWHFTPPAPSPRTDLNFIAFHAADLTGGDDGLRGIPLHPIGLPGFSLSLRLTVVPVDALYWSTSGQIVIRTLLGGSGAFFRPFVGAATFLMLADRLSLFPEAWPLVIGLIFMAFVLFLPKGIWGTLLGRIT